MEKTTKNIAIFASGTGTNAREIIRFFKEKSSIAKVSLIVTNNPIAGVLLIADLEKIPVYLIPKEDLYEGKQTLETIRSRQIDVIVLAGYLKKIPAAIVDAYSGKMINIHPALLPKFGGKGMYGTRVHKAVLEAGEKETGITIHHVNSHYDEGDIIFQAACLIEKNDTIQSIQEKVRVLEHEHYPRIINRLIES
jgi:phosphoribosylglycinamide formyltransferase 1